MIFKLGMMEKGSIEKGLVKFFIKVKKIMLSFIFFKNIEKVIFVKVECVLLRIIIEVKWSEVW